MDKFQLSEIIAKVVRVKGAPLDEVSERAYELMAQAKLGPEIESLLMDLFEEGGAL